MENLPRSKTYYRDPLHNRTVSWRPKFPTKESSNVSFSGALDTLELKDKKFVEWMKKNYIEDLEYIGMMPCAKSSGFRKIYPIIDNGTDRTVSWRPKDLENIGMMPCAKSSNEIYPISELYNTNVGNGTDTYGGRYEHHLETAKGGYKPRSKKSHKKGFKNIHAKKTRKFHK